jgi:hypothetical protein
MIITSEFFCFNVWEWFLHSSVLERTEFDLSKINWLCGVILLIPIVLVPWGRFPMCHTHIRPISAFWDQISILIVGCVTTWSRGLHQLYHVKMLETYGMLSSESITSMFTRMTIIISLDAFGRTYTKAKIAWKFLRPNQRLGKQRWW